MKRLWFFVVLMALSSSASAGGSISFTVGGHRVHIESSRHCRSTSCASVSVSGVNERRSRSISDREDVTPARTAPPVSQTVSPPRRPRPHRRPRRPPPRHRPSTRRPHRQRKSSRRRRPRRRLLHRSPFPWRRHLRRRHRSQSRSNPCGHRRRSSRVSHDVEEEAADSPIGDWQTEGKGTVRIAKCGNALCGYVLNASSNDKGEAILINMKPKTDRQWTGSVYSQDSGETYYGTMAIKGINTLRVEACALGRFYCSGNNWSRIGSRADNLRDLAADAGRAAFVSAQGKVFMKTPGGVTTGRKGPSGRGSPRTRRAQ